MNDTPSKIQALYDQMIQEKSPEERVLMGCSMHDFSKQIVLSQFSALNKYHAEVMGEVFLRFYKDDFDKETSEKIINRIQEYFRF